MSGPDRLFADLLAADPSRPLITYYDESSGERTELSVRSLANWVAKTHYLLTEELLLEPGDAAVFALPPHWLSLAPLFGAVSAGVALRDPGPSDDTAAAVAFVSPDTAPRAAGIAEVFAINPAAAALGFGGAPPAGCTDFVPAVRAQPDHWPTHLPAEEPTAPCLGPLRRAELVAAAIIRAGELNLPARARVLCTPRWNRLADLVDTVFAPLAVGGSLIYVLGDPDEATLARRAEQERATARL